MPRRGPGKTSDITKRVGEALRRLRESQHLSQLALARKVGTSRSEINGIETGQRAPTIVSLDHLARSLRVPVTAFFEKEPSVRTTPTPEEVVINRVVVKLRAKDLKYLRNIETFLGWFDRTQA